MKNILLPTDFSDNSWNAIAYALELYKDESCRFHLFNAYTPIIYQVEYVLVNPAQFGLGDAIRDTSKENLSKLHSKIIKEFGDNPNHLFDKIARFDTLVSGVRELIEERSIDMIIMGTNGATGAREVLFGSNTVQVLREVKCPIMAIPSKYKFKTPKNILFPSDLKVNYSETQLHILQEIAMGQNSTIHTMHVSTGHELSEEQKNNKVQLEKLLKPAKFHDFENMEIPDAINKFQAMRPIDFLVMINNKHSFFENLFFKNTIHQIGFHLKVPFLVIHSK